MWILSINHVTDVTDRSNSLVVVVISSLPRAFFLLIVFGAAQDKGYGVHWD